MQIDKSRAMMKVRVADDLPIVSVGSSKVKGKVLVSLEDGVGCAMYEFNVHAGDELTLIAFHPDHNHIYYCIEGRCIIHDSATKQLSFTADHLLALTSGKSVHMRVQELVKIVAVSVPRDASVSPPHLLMKSLDEVIDSDRNVPFENGFSRRFLAAPDGYNISFHNTFCSTKFSKHLQYLNNKEVVYFIKGQGEYVWENGKRRHDFDSEKHHGTMFLVANNAHEVKIGARDSIAICLFFPPLMGNERLKTGQENGSSY